MYDNGIFVVVFLTLTFSKHRPVRNIRQPVIPLTDCDLRRKSVWVRHGIHVGVFPSY